MIKKIRHFLVISFAAMIFMCVAVFIWIGMSMSTKSRDTISDVGMIYMSEMSKQFQQKFSTVIDLRLSQVKGIMERTSPEYTDDIDELRAELALSASVRDFTYLGFYTADGEFEVIYGKPLEIANPQAFFGYLKKGENRVSSGFSNDGDRLLVLGVPAEYRMENGKTSMALVAGFPIDYINEALFLDGNDALVYSHIIDTDGKFVIRNSDAFRENYFDRIRETFSEFNGKTSEQYAQELKKAMENDEDYFALVSNGEVQSHLYCSSLSNSEWYLVTIMPHGSLDEAVNELGNERIYTMMIACGVLVIIILVIFALYYRLSQQQMKELDEARKEATHANQAKSEFLSNMSHDIRTPMNAIVGMTAIAIANINDSARVQDCLKKITLSSKHLLGLINDVLDMSKIENGKLSLNMSQISLRDVMDSIVSIVQPQIKAKHQYFDIFIQEIDTEDVYCDGVRLNQVLLNLLSNALKFTPEGGSISLHLSQEPSPVGDNYIRVHIRVKDTGIGMTPEFQKTIFEAFTRDTSAQVQKIEGTGLGMAITKYIIDVMEGTIEVQSELGKGTEFHVTLDLEMASIQEADMILPSWNMLVVDDDEQLCHSAVSSLKEIGVNAEWTLDGEKAVEMVEKRHMRNDDYDVVLLDWKMPGMNGLQTSKEIRKHLGDDIPIILISAYDWGDIEDEAREAGVSGFISKPLFKSTLFFALNRFVENGEDVSEQKEERVITDFSGKRILLAEDNDLNWEIANEILTNAGFELEWAENGKVCVEKFKKSDVGFFDVILMDIRMPVMNGYDAATAIRALDRSDAKEMPIIAMTADAFSEDIQHCLECGMNAHIAKPIDVNELIHKLEKCLK